MGDGPLSKWLPSIASPDLTEAEWKARDAALAAKQAEADAEVERKRLAELRHHLAEHGAPVKDLDRAIAGDLRPTEAVVAVREAFERGSTLVALSGVPGLGKTTAACWWLIQQHPRPTVTVRPARFIRAGQLARWPRFDEDRMRDLERARALVLDDLGVEYDDTKGAIRSLLDDLIDARYAACLPTLITTNLKGDAFKARYHERIADRIREAGGFVPLRGESMRGRG